MNSILKLPMQYFAEEKPEEPENTEQGAGDKEKPGEGKTFTQEDVNAIVAREVKKALKKAGQPSQPGAAAPPASQPAHSTAEGAGEPAAGANPEVIAANRAVLEVKAQLAAIKEGVSPAMAEDAVYLAIREAEKAGEADEQAVADALKEVLKRHPEWKPQKEEDQKGGFRVGAGAGENPQKDGKPLPKGRVFF
ncbi:MAG: hypothetical protein PHD67_10735 [Oscillospiraceae bacterium]|nr:hypothetical protein [Oscillospiraceae bacterium]